MKMILLIALLSFLPVSSVVSGADVPLTTGEWVGFALWKLEANGLISPMFASSMPLEREEIAQILTNIRIGMDAGQLSPSSLELGLINKLEAEFDGDLSPHRLKVRGLPGGEAGYHHDDWETPSASLWCAAGFYPASWITLYEELDIRRGREIVGEEGETASRRITPWRDYTADFQRAYIRFHQEWFEILVGRQSLLWGPAYDSSLILSDNSPAFDMVLLKARFGSVKGTAFSAILDKRWSERGDPPYRYLANRYLSGHRIDWIVNDRLKLGLCELVLYGGEARDMELQYINPLLPYYASQWNEKRDDNVLASADFSARPVDGLKLYGQLLVDDFQYSRRAPDALGYAGGFYLSDLLRLPGTDLRAEYTRINTWTYTHRIEENQFTHYGWIIGHHLGPDADQLLIELSRMINLDIHLKLIYTYERQGSRTVADRYAGEDYKHKAFPSGTVERLHKIRLRFLWEPVHGPQVDISCGGVFTRSQGTTAQGSELSVTAGFSQGWSSLEGN